MSNTNDRAVGPYPTMVGNTAIVQAYAYGKFLGELNVTFDDDGKVVEAAGEPLIMDNAVTEDQAALDRIAELAVPLDEIRMFGVTEDDFFKVYGAHHSYKKGKLRGVSQFKFNRILLNAIVKKEKMLSVIAHELVHFFLNDKMKDSRLFGIEEGLANYLGKSHKIS